MEWLLGTGDSRGIALILVIAGLACAIVALAAFLTPQYRLISTQYETTASKGDPGQRAAHDLETEVGRSRSAESLIA